MDTTAYRSFLVRLWRDSAPDGVWRGEVESIQSGQVMAAASLDEVLQVIQQAVGRPLPPPSQRATDG